MYITSVFLKLGESIYVAMDLIPILLGSLPLAHNAQHSLVICIYVFMYMYIIIYLSGIRVRVPDTVNF